MSSTYMTGRPVFPSTGCTFNLSTHNKDRVSQLRESATFVISTGACTVQTYLSAEECEELSSLLLQAATEIRELNKAEAA